MKTKLSPREKQVLAYLSRGHADKWIAHQLGLAASTVSNHLARVRRKLRVRRRAALIRLLAPAAGEIAWQCLTPAEQEVAAAVFAGLSNAQIAERRGTSLHTVANQLRGIYLKLRLSGRGELAARLASGGDLLGSVVR